MFSDWGKVSTVPTWKPPPPYSTASEFTRADPNMRTAAYQYYANRNGRAITKYKKRSTPYGRNIKYKISRRNKTYRMLKYEKKYFDTYVVTNCKAIPPMGWLNFPNTGAGPKDRIGNKIQIISVQIHARIFQLDIPSGSGVTSNQLVRVSLMQDKQPNGAATSTTTADVLDLGVITDKGLAFPNTMWSKRFKKLKEQVFEMDKINGEVYSLDWFVPLNIETVYSGSTGSPDDINTNALFLMYESTVDTLPTDAVFITYGARIRYYDT